MIGRFDTFFAPAELKFLGDDQPGCFSGYGSINNEECHYGDVILPGAFKDTLADHKSKGTMPAMFAEHSFFMFGDPLPIGVWQSMEEDEKGLKCVGKLSALDSDHSKRIVGLMRDGAMRGLSIAFRVPEGGAKKGKKAGEPVRTLSKIDLFAVDVVRAPAQPSAQVDHIRSVLAVGDHKAAARHIADAVTLHRTALAGGDSPTKEERDKLMEYLQGAHIALTGEAAKSAPTTIREFETYLREEFGLSHSQAREIAERGFKSVPRDGGNDSATSAGKTLLEELGPSLTGFKLPSF